MITIIIEEGFAHRRKCGDKINSLEVSEISRDISGVTLYYFEKRKDIDIPFVTEDIRINTIEKIKILLPECNPEKYQCKITLGTFIDLLGKIY